MPICLADPPESIVAGRYSRAGVQQDTLLFTPLTRHLFDFKCTGARHNRNSGASAGRRAVEEEEEEQTAEDG